MLNLNSTILMSDAQNFSVDIPINPYYKFHDVDYTQAIKEHDEVLKILESIGIKIIQVPSPA
ncbi:hypothetical protein HGB24_03345, partial [Candidatus Saccharibacteria bacterium]|nr:hypothetical protein [Candidatus Saccharibacteria bacterium]